MAEKLISAFTLYADIKNQSSYALTIRTKTKGKICQFKDLYKSVKKYVASTDAKG